MPVDPMIQPNCRARFTGEDFDFVVRTLARSPGNKVGLVELLTDIETSGAKSVRHFLSASDRSMKKTRGSGGFRRLELAADRFLDVERLLAIVLGEISDRLRTAWGEHRELITV